MRVLTYLHLHPFEGYSVLLVERSSHHYPVDSPRAHVGPFSSTALMLSERRAGEDGLSSPTTTFPLGDLRVEQDGLIRYHVPRPAAQPDDATSFRKTLEVLVICAAQASKVAAHGSSALRTSARAVWTARLCAR
jgi:hypothetical protein